MDKCAKCGAQQTTSHTQKIQGYSIVETRYQCGAELREELPQYEKTWIRKCPLALQYERRNSEHQN